MNVYRDTVVFSKRVYLAPSSNGLWASWFCYVSWVFLTSPSGHRRIVASLLLDYDYVLTTTTKKDCFET